MNETPVCIIGGTGFVGHHLIYRLSAAGHPCRLLVRRPERHRELRLAAGLDIREADLFDADQLTHHLVGCGTLVNLAGILSESGQRTFQRVHVDLVARLVAAAREAGVTRLLHLSALGADAAAGPSRYLRSKGAGEDLAHGEGAGTMAVTSFRPAAIFGPGDHLFNRFATLLRLAPGILPLPCPAARLAPVYVGDLVAAILAALADPRTHGQRYSLCGPRVFRLQELVEYTARQIGRRTRVVGLDDAASRLQARIFEHLPGKPFSEDAYLSLQAAGVCTEDGLAALGIQATDVEAIVPTYLR